MKTALVTGASAGIGEAIAQRLLADGYRVFAGARRVQRMAGLAEAGAVTLALDVTDDASMVAAVDRIMAEAGRIDVLVNNAGYGSYGSLEEVPLAEARRQFEVNVFGLARLTQLVLPAMREARSGAIVNISSIGGKIYEPFGAWYHASKFAVEGFSDSLRLELEPLGIRVIVIEPGSIESEWSGIARDNLLQNSGSGSYAVEARAHAEAARRHRRRSRPAGGGGEDRVACACRAAAAHALSCRRRRHGRSFCCAQLLPDRLFDRALEADVPDGRLNATASWISARVGKLGWAPSLVTASEPATAARARAVRKLAPSSSQAASTPQKVSPAPVVSTGVT